MHSMHVSCPPACEHAQSCGFTKCLLRLRQSCHCSLFAREINWLQSTTGWQTPLWFIVRQDESRAKQLTAQLERSSASLAAAKQALADETTEARAAQVCFHSGPSASPGPSQDPHLKP